MCIYTYIYININETADVDRDTEKKEHLYPVWRNVNWYSHFGKKYGGSLKN